MSPELTQLLADAPNMEKFPKTRLIELGLAEGWPPVLTQNYFIARPRNVSISGIIDSALTQGILPVENHEESLSISWLPDYPCLPKFPANWFAHCGWRHVLEAADQWRKSHDRVVHIVRIS